MKECDFASLGLSLKEIYKRTEYGYEVRMDLYSANERDLVAWFSVTTKLNKGEQVLTMNSQFIQRNYLTYEQIDAVTEWLRRSTVPAR